MIRPPARIIFIIFALAAFFSVSFYFGWIAWKFIVGLFGYQLSPWMYWGFIVFTTGYLLWWDWNRRRK
jgi:hypothetical protein